MRGRALQAVLGVVATLHVCAASAGGRDPFVFFHPSAVVSPAHRQHLESGAPVVELLAAGGQQLAVLSMVPIGSGVTPERAVAWTRQLDRLRANRYVLASRRFSASPTLADLDGLTLDSDDLADMASCRAGHCDVKLTVTEIEDVRRVIAAAGREWRPAAERLFREIVLGRVRRYLAGGHRALAPYRDHKRPSSPADTFARLLNNSPFLQQRLPGVIEDLASAPARSVEEGRGFLYWSKERLGGKPVITATHVIAVPGPEATSVDAVAIGIQVFATHYVEGALGVTAFVRDAGGRVYLVYLHRTDIDILGGFWGGLARSVIESRLRKDGPRILKEIADRISAADPVFPGVPAATSAR